MNWKIIIAFTLLLSVLCGLVDGVFGFIERSYTYYGNLPPISFIFWRIFAAFASATFVFTLFATRRIEHIDKSAWTIWLITIIPSFLFGYFFIGNTLIAEIIHGLLFTIAVALGLYLGRRLSLRPG